MQAQRYTFKQFIPIGIETAWDFFSSPHNLAKITPPEMKFIVTSPHNKEAKMYAGMIITYKVSPILGIKLNWMTEITHVQEHRYFVDEQRFGPYAFWHHQHHFEIVSGGVNMTDILHYSVPYGALGVLAKRFIVKQQIKKIFDYRENAIIKMFGA